MRRELGLLPPEGSSPANVWLLMLEGPVLLETLINVQLPAGLGPTDPRLVTRLDTLK